MLGIKMVNNYWTSKLTDSGLSVICWDHLISSLHLPSKRGLEVEPSLLVNRAPWGVCVHCSEGITKGSSFLHIVTEATRLISFICSSAIEILARDPAPVPMIVTEQLHTYVCTSKQYIPVECYNNYTTTQSRSLHSVSASTWHRVPWTQLENHRNHHPIDTVWPL